MESIITQKILTSAQPHGEGISVEESENLSSDVVSSGLVVVHDSLVGGEDNVSELS